MKVTFKKQRGFTLVELAIVLAVMGFLVASLLTPLGVQKDVRDYAKTRSDLAEYKAALIGYALSQTPPFLPCPDINGDGIEDNRNGAGNCINDASVEISSGNIPWVTLGLSQTDSWNNTYLYSVTPEFSNSNGFTLAAIGMHTILDNAGGAQQAVNIPVVVISKGKNGVGTSADEAENDTTNTTFVSHEQIDVSATQFDDLVVWVPSTVLFNRLVQAGRLP